MPLGQSHGVMNPRDIGTMSLSEVTAPPLTTAISYWREQTAAGDPYPPRHAIDPLDIPRLLPHVVLYTAESEGGTFYVRVWGTHVRDIFHSDLTGARLGADEVGNIAATALPRLRHVAAQGEPLAAQNAVHLAGREHVTYQVVHLPLGQPAVDVSHVFTVVADAPHADASAPPDGG